MAITVGGRTLYLPECGSPAMKPESNWSASPQTCHTGHRCVRDAPCYTGYTDCPRHRSLIPHQPPAQRLSSASRSASPPRRRPDRVRRHQALEPDRSRPSNEVERHCPGNAQVVVARLVHVVIIIAARRFPGSRFWPSQASTAIKEALELAGETIVVDG